MDADETLFCKRLAELADKAYTNSQYFYTGFLTLDQQDCYYRMERELSYAQPALWGGTADCERVMLRFGSEELCGWEEPFPIACIEIAPLLEKFAQELSHRDYLGALMNLGIERSTLGDILVRDKTAYLFCTEQMAPYVIEHLEQVNHTHVRCRIADEVPESVITKLERRSLVVSSDRTDAIVAKVYNLSRSQSVDLFRAKKIFVNGRLNENNSGTLKADDRVSVRGYGKFIFRGMAYETKKGRICVEVDRLV